MQDLQKIVDFITRSNWLILLVGGIIGLAMTPVKFAMGIILGGLIVAINFHLLRHTLKKIIDILKHRPARMLIPIFLRKH